MMIIKKEKTLYHLYALESDFSQDLVSYCLYLKQSLGWKEFQWDLESKKWRFKDPAIIVMIKNKFLDLEIDLEVKNDVRLYEQSVVEEQERDKNARRIKESTTSSLQIKGVKGELYEYQKLGVELLILVFVLLVLVNGGLRYVSNLNIV